jgi:hypothetical protein
VVYHVTVTKPISSKRFECTIVREDGSYINANDGTFVQQRIEYFTLIKKHDDTPYYAKSSIEEKIIRHSGSIQITNIFFESTETGTLKEYWNGGGVFMDISPGTRDYDVAKSLLPVGYWYRLELDAFWWLLGKIVKIKEA